MKKKWECPELMELGVEMTQQYVNSSKWDFLSGTHIGEALQVGSMNTGKGKVVPV